MEQPVLLFWYYALRDLSLMYLPFALDQVFFFGLSIFAVFYGLDWIATVPPTVRLTADLFGKENGGIMFGWIVAGHQIGAATAAFGAGMLRTVLAPASRRSSWRGPSASWPPCWRYASECAPSGKAKWRRPPRNAARNFHMGIDDGLIGVRGTVLPTGPPVENSAVGSATVAPAVSASVARPVADRTRLLLEGPIARTLLRLAAPNVVVMAVQAAVNAGEAYFLGWLGADALAGVSLAFPLIMLMQTMSAGGIGGGVSSAVARALGAGRRSDANALVLHALVIAIVMAAGFTGALLLGGPALYRAMGGTGGALTAALAYSDIVFGGAIAVWLFNTLASVVRGTGNMLLPASVVVGGAVLTLSLSPALIFGWGRVPPLGIAGAAAGLVAYYAAGSLVLFGYLLSGRSLVRLSLSDLRLCRRLFREILRVGAPSLLNNVQTNLTVVLLTGLVGPFGTTALAGYGMGARLEYLQIPLVFGFGSALVTMVGTNIGAERRARAERIAWTGTGMAAALTGAIGLGAALVPHAWLGLFSTDPAVLQVGAIYLRIVGPTYGFFGLGLALYFASQGAGQLLWPLLAGFSRLVIASAGGWIAIRWFGGGLTALFGVMAIAFVVSGGTLMLAVKSGGWRLATLRAGEGS